MIGSNACTSSRTPIINIGSERTLKNSTHEPRIGGAIRTVGDGSGWGGGLRIKGVRSGEGGRAGGGERGGVWPAGQRAGDWCFTTAPLLPTTWLRKGNLLERNEC
jgi:hypothetical protein